MSPHPLHRLTHDDRGGAAVEFALVAPVLAAILATAVLVWSDLTAAARMRAAVHAGADYLRAYGHDPAMVSAVVDRSWETKPDGAEITVAEFCSCGAAASSCEALCPAGDPPLVYVEIRAATAASSDTKSLIGRSAAEVVRVR